MNVTILPVKMEVLASTMMAHSLARVRLVTLEACALLISMNVTILPVKMEVLASTMMAHSLAHVQPVTLEACVM